MRFRVKGKRQSGERVVLLVEALHRRHARQLVERRKISVSSVVTEGDFYDRLWARVTPFLRCDRCHRWLVLRLLALRKDCRRCAKLVRTEAASRLEKHARDQQLLAEDCFAELIGMSRRNEDSNTNVTNTLARYAASGLNDTEKVWTSFSMAKRVEEVRFGRFPIITNTGLGLHAQEVAHYVFPNAALYERRVVGQEVVGRSSGVTLFGDGMAFSFGGSEGHWTNIEGDVHLGTGRLILTSQRFVFSSPTAGLNVPWARMLNITLLPGGIQVVSADADGSGSPRFIRCDDAQFLCYSANALREAPQRDGPTIHNALP
jgi:hypothetical protein